MDDAKLEELLSKHTLSIIEYVSNLRADLKSRGEPSLELDDSNEQNDDLDKAEKESLLKRNSELALILSHSQKTVSEQEVEIKELKLALSRAQHQIADLTEGPGSRRTSAVSSEDCEGDVNPYLVGSSGMYVAESAAEILKETTSPEINSKEGLEESGGAVSREGIADHGGTRNSTEESVAAAVEDEPEGVVVDKEEEEEEEEANEATATLTRHLRRIHRALLICTGGWPSTKELGKAEFDLLAQLVGLEAGGAALRSDLVSHAGLVPRAGLPLRAFLRGFLHKGLTVPGTQSVPAAVWMAVSATEMGAVVLDPQRRGLLETELSRWAKQVEEHAADGDAELVESEDSGDDDSGDGHAFSAPEDGSEEEEEAEPWVLGSEYGAGAGLAALKLKYTLLGRKQGEPDLGEGRAGVVRKAKLLGTATTTTTAAMATAEEDGGEGGEGGDGAVVLACKCISKSQQSLEETERELSIMKKLVGVAGVVQLRDVYDGPDRLFVLSDLCLGGELYDQVIQRADQEAPFSELEAATVLKQVLSAVAMLHDEHGVVHRDIKPENLLLKRSDAGLDEVVLIDFGLSRFFEPGQRLMTRVGTVYYTAPEVWAERYDNKCDVFSCGVLLYVLLCLYTPFDGDDDNDILRKVMRGKFTFPEEEWGGISDEAKDLVKKLMSKYPRRRPSAREALDHEWFRCLDPAAAGSAETGSEGAEEDAEAL